MHKSKAGYNKPKFDVIYLKRRQMQEKFNVALADADCYKLRYYDIFDYPYSGK